MDTGCGRLQVVEQNPHHLYGPGDKVALAIDTADVILLEK
jgi:hypothetical protein